MPLVLLLLLTALSLFAGDQQLLPSATIHNRLARVHVKNEERLAELRKLFDEAGCDSRDLIENRILSSKLPNLICRLSGSSKKTVVVTAHFDNRGPGEGAVDNWSGASMLPSLFETLRASAHRLTFVFVATTDEEKGLIGSRDYVNHLSKEEQGNILLDVNIDCVGLKGPIHAWGRRSDDFLLQLAIEVADRTRLYVRSDTMDPRYDSDASAFTAWRIPVIDFHSLTPETLPLLHSKQDVRTALDLNTLYDHYQFLSAYLAHLDQSLAL